jgi:nucleoside-triphosphatase THEP1/general stress protein 26
MEPRRTSPLKGLVDRILAEVNSHKATHPVLLVGGIGSGKTSTGLRLLSLLRWSGVRVGGFLAPRVMEEDETVGYSLIDLTTNATHAFASLEPSDVSIGRFFVSEKDLATAHRAVTTALNEASVVFIDEVGRLELDGGGHASAVQQLLASKVVPILLVRDELVDEVTRTFGIVEPVIFHARDALEATIASPVGVRTFWGIVDSLPYPLLVTLSEDGFPWPRPMHLVDRDANRLWFATSRASKKVSQIKVNPHVTVLFVDSVRFNYASIQGHARVVADPDRERTLWRDEWHDDWPNGPSDPDYVLLRVDGVRGHYLRGTTGEVGIVDLACSDAA